jgi:hypothetical protein
MRLKQKQQFPQTTNSLSFLTPGELDITGNVTKRGVSTILFCECIVRRRKVYMEPLPSNDIGGYADTQAAR